MNRPNPPASPAPSPAAGSPSRRAVAAVALGVLLAACSDDGRDSANGALGADEPEPAIISPLPAPYREVPVADAGRLEGRVTLEGEPPPPEVARPLAMRRVCGDSVVTRVVQTGRDGGLANAVVWLADAQAGKPIPLRRRYELTHEDCRLEPRVLGVLAGGTVNVRSQDQIEQRTALVRQGDGETLAVVRQYDFGQVVPVHRAFTTPALVGASSELYPWMRAWVAAFDHPYWAVTGPEGRFTLDSVPPGTYRLAVWHERYGKSERTVTVPASGEEAVEVRVGGRE